MWQRKWLFTPRKSKGKMSGNKENRLTPRKRKRIGQSEGMAVAMFGHSDFTKKKSADEAEFAKIVSAYEAELAKKKSAYEAELAKKKSAYEAELAKIVSAIEAQQSAIALEAEKLKLLRSSTTHVPGLITFFSVLCFDI
jgi:uncharacterized protein YeaO (DUF488 family)